MAEKMRLQRYLAVAGVTARRKAEELIVAGRVRVNGKQVRKLGTTVDPNTAHVTVDGEAVAPLDFFYVLFNKPKGCVAAVSDDRDRPTVMEYLPNLPVPVRPVGRLDFYAEGVLLLTNDGELAARLVAPQRGISRTYHVKVRGELAPNHLERLRTGVRLEDGSTTLPAEVDLLPGESRHCWLAITVIESGERLVQDMLEALGYQVQKLQRVAYATLSFHGLRVGDARELTQGELNALRDLVELDHRPVARGAWRSTREDTDLSRRARERQRAEEAESGGPPTASLAPASEERRGGPPASDPRGGGQQRPDLRGARRTGGTGRAAETSGTGERGRPQGRANPRGSQGAGRGLAPTRGRDRQRPAADMSSGGRPQRSARPVAAADAGSRSRPPSSSRRGDELRAPSGRREGWAGRGGGERGGGERAGVGAADPRSARPARSGPAGRPGRPERPGRPGRPGRGDERASGAAAPRSARPERSGPAGRPGRPERPGRPGRGDERAGGGAAAPRSARPQSKPSGGRRSAPTGQRSRAKPARR